MFKCILSCFPYSENEGQLEAVLEVEVNQVIPKRRYKEAETRTILHCNHASARFRQVIIHTPDTDVFVIVFGFARSLNCELFIKTGIKDKNIIISILRIIDKLKLIMVSKKKKS